MTDAAAHASDPAAQPGGAPGDLADLLLASLVLDKAVSIQIEPDIDGHIATFESGRGDKVQVALGGDVGDAAMVRIALLAGLDLATSPSQFGRLLADVSGSPGEVFILLNRGREGFSMELRRIASAPRNDRSALPGPGPRPETEDADRMGPYRLLQALGSGGLGAVYRAEHVALEKPVALKILHPHIAEDPQQGAILLREGRAASRVRHPGIVDVTDFGTTANGRMYLVMELVTWPTLEATSKRKPMPPQTAINIARNTLKAIGAAHAHGIVHRDLKPSNVFVSPKGQIKICDFGAAAVAAGHRPIDAKQEGEIFGTADYMAPEQARGEIDRRTDLYAVGVILYELLSGRLPFSAKTPMEIIMQHMEAPVPPLVTPQDPLPEIFSTIIERALAKNPEDRYQRVSDMVTDLDHAQLALTRKGWRKWLPV